MYKLFLGLKANYEPIIEFSNSEKEIINHSINQMIINKKLEWAFQILETNFNELFSQTNLLFQDLSLKQNLTWEELETVTLEINRLFLNYLASQNTYLDHSLKYLDNHFGNNSNQFLGFKTLTNNFFANKFAYRLLYNLRNYSVHYGYSVCGIRINKDKKSVSFTPVFLLNELKLYKKWHSLIKKDLQKLNEDFKAFNLIKESFECFKELYKYITVFLLESNKENRGNILNLIKIDIEKLHDYCFLLECGDHIKIAQIPVHYLK